MWCEALGLSSPIRHAGSSAYLRRICGIASLIALLCGTNAHAIVFPHTYTVGPKPACDYATIQEAIAAASATAGDTIELDATLSYAGQHLTITGKSLTIQSGAACTIGAPSPAAPANAQAAISGNAGATTAVLTITNGNVTLTDLEITGNTSSASAGGIAYSGNGTLTLNNVAVTNNKGTSGGGIEFDGAGSLVLGAGTQIVGNTATGDGGGIAVYGTFATLHMVSSGSYVASNHADSGAGGGILLYGATGYLDSPDAAGIPLIYLNTAMDGGGIAVVSSPDSGALAVIGSSGHTTRIEGNSAGDPLGGGGGVYLVSSGFVSTGTTFYSHALLEAINARIEHNIAVEGSAIFADCGMAATACDSASEVSVSTKGCAGLDCNTIAGNESETTDGQPTLGAAVFLRGSEYQAFGVHMRGNHGAHTVRGVSGSDLELRDCLEAENVLTAEPFIFSTGYFSIKQCTLANDTIGEPPVVSTSDAEVHLTYNVIGEDVAALLAIGGTLEAHNIVARNTDGLPASSDIFKGDPLFIDVAGSDYRLSVLSYSGDVVFSPAVDFAPVPGNDLTDIDGRPRDQDVSAVPDESGPRDLGAYEMQPITDRVFVGTFGDAYLLVY